MLSAFEVSAAGLVQKLDVKFDFWKKIPYRLAALAHRDPGTAAEAASDCLQQYDALGGDEDSGIHHRLSVLFLSRGSQFRECVFHLASRQRKLEDMQLFHEVVSRFGVLSVNDRRGEQPHAEVKRVITRATDSKAYTVDVEFRSREILQALEDTTMFEEIAAHVEALPNAHAVLREHNLRRHPQVAQVPRAALDTKKAWPIVYRCDPMAQYECRAQHKKDQDNSRKRQRIEDKGAGLLHVRPVTLAHSAIDFGYQDAVFQHAKKMFEKTPDCIFSIPHPSSAIWEGPGGFLVRQDVAMTMEGLYKKPHAVAPAEPGPTPDPKPLKPLVIDGDSEDVDYVDASLSPLALPAAGGNGLLFFSVTDWSPSRSKTLSMQRATCTPLLLTDVAVVLYEAAQCLFSKCFVFVIWFSYSERHIRNPYAR